MPIYIEYKYINGKKADTSELRDKVCWYGDMDFGSHIIELLKLKKIEVHVYFGEKIKTDTTGNRSIARKAVCAKAYLQTEKLKRTSASEN
jgi:lipoprotein NlpI